MPTNDLDRLRAAIDKVANALQPAALLTGRLRHSTTEAAEDAVAVDEALTRAITILKVARGDAGE